MKPGEPLKRTPLERKTPLQAKTGLRRSTPMQEKAGREQPGARTLKRLTGMKPSRPTPAVPLKQRTRLQERADGWCEIRQAGCYGRGLDAAHRVGRGMGGRHGEAAVEAAQLSNVVYACRSCHRLCHGKPTFAERMGWFVPEGTDPRTVPVLIGGRMVLLDDEGGVTDADPRDGLQDVG